ncbi:hypothetical protein BDY19DRAFT_990013 [Irpex rosettiformis]|uniref:Uncharacterized protein n=1 Tax=Irpex rosettiformis TaxID=378272 RepID=A0ACB8UG29_9APHY|nr:hypothetical protein BDY19DRAFT_990013 [Irpex rosettiformis]
MTRLMFTDLEKEWLHRQLDSPDIMVMLAANPSRILEADTAGNAVKVLRGRRNGDGNFKKAAVQITNTYLATFNAPFTEESQLEFNARKKAMRNLGITFCHRRQAETNDQFQARISFEPLSKRIYNWLLSHSPNKVKKAPYARIASTSAPSRRYTPYGVFKASGATSTPSTSDTAPSASANIGDWNKTLHSTFVNQTQDQLQILQKVANTLNASVEGVLPDKSSKHLQHEKARQLESTIVDQLLDWTIQTGYMGFIILGGKNSMGEVRNFTVNNAATRGGMSFTQHMCNRFRISEQQWQTELDWFFQEVYNGGTCSDDEAASDTVEGETSASDVVLAPLSFFAREGSTTEEPPAKEDAVAEDASPKPVQCEHNGKPASADEVGSTSSDNVPPGDRDKMLLDAHLVLPPFTGTPDVSALSAVTPPAAPIIDGEQDGNRQISPTTDSSVDTGVHEEQTPNTSEKQFSRRARKVDAAGCSLPPEAGMHGNVNRRPSKIGPSKVTRSGRRIIPKTTGTAAYDEVVLRQNAASRRSRK